MCKQDITIKRKTAYRTVTVTTAIGQYIQALPPNPDRVAVVMSYVVGGALDVGSLTTLVAGPAIAAPIVAAISLGRPSNRVVIEELGQLCTAAVGVVSNDSNAPEVCVTEVYFTERLDDL